MHVVHEFVDILADRRPQPLRECFTTGRTVLIPKDAGKHPLADDNARPINCLPGIYKLLTKTLECALSKDLDKVLTDEQKGWRSFRLSQSPVDPRGPPCLRSR